MTKITKIDDFVSDFGSMYGLEAKGNCYLVNSDFYLEIISSYDEDKSIEGDIKYVTPFWSRIKVSDGDLISVTKNGCYLELKDFDGFVECRPEIESKDTEPKFDKFPNEYLDSIGKNILSSKPMSFEERKKVTMSRL